MTALEVALCVLQNEGEPMHYRDIAPHALEHHMLDTSGKTTDATMYAQILSEVKRRKGRGELQRFIFLRKRFPKTTLHQEQ